MSIGAKFLRPCATGLFVAILHTPRMSQCDKSNNSDEFGVSAIQLKELENIKKQLSSQLAKKVEIEDPEGDMAWEIEKSGCSFCQYFLHSPCSVPFRKWSKCVDLAKDANLDYVSTCSSYTDALMLCTETNAEYFSAARDEARKAESEASEASSSNSGRISHSSHSSGSGGDSRSGGDSSSSKRSTTAAAP